MCHHKAAIVFAIFISAVILSPSAVQAGQVEIEQDLGMRAMVRLVHEEPEQFLKQWNERRRMLEAGVAESESPVEAKKTKQNIAWLWAAGVINYPYFRQRETGEKLPGNWAPKQVAIRSISFNDDGALGSPAFTAAVTAWLHEEAGALLKEAPSLMKGDNRWLRAYFTLLEKNVGSKVVRAHFMNRFLEEHIDENGAKNIDTQIEVARRNGVSESQIAKFQAALAAENAPPSDHVVRTYQRVDGVDLQLHIFPSKKQAQLAPVLIWFHGGSWSTGHWSYCPVICQSLQEHGFTVIQVEYRTSQRFDGTPLDALQDAYKSIDWAIDHANEFGIDRKKIMAGGFSSGASLASQMAVLNHAKVSAAVYMSGGFDPAKDSWYNSVVSSRRDTKSLSPLRMLDAKSPPQILFHAKDDEMCSYDDALAMQRKLSTLGIPNRLVSFEQGGHFFVFKSPVDRQRISAELRNFVDTLRW